MKKECDLQSRLIPVDYTACDTFSKLNYQSYHMK